MSLEKVKAISHHTTSLQNRISFILCDIAMMHRGDVQGLNTLQSVITLCKPSFINPTGGLNTEVLITPHTNVESVSCQY